MSVKILYCFTVCALVISSIAIEVPDINHVMADAFKNAYPNHIKGPKSLNDRILIIGAGVSGIHMSHLLKQAGFNNVEIFEKTDRLGGKSRSVNYRGAVHELGTLYMTNDYQNTVIQLIKKYTNSTLVKPPLSTVWFQNHTKELPLPDFLFYDLKRKHPSKSLADLKQLFVGKISHYIKLHQDLFGVYLGELMKEPSEETIYKIRGTFLEFLQRNALTELEALFMSTFVLQGYGHLDEVPALYGLMWNTPTLMFSVMNMIHGKGSALYSLSNGFEELWQALAEKTNFSIHYNINIRYIYLNDAAIDINGQNNKVFVYYNTKENDSDVKVESYDFLIWSPNAKDILKIIGGKNLVKEEEIFHGITNTFYTTSLVNVNNTPRSSSPINWYFEHIKSKKEAEVWASRDSYAVLKNYAGFSYYHGVTPTGNDEEKFRSSVFYQYGREEHTERFLRSKLSLELKEIGVKNCSVIEMVQWPYFNRFSQECIETGCHWRVLDLQGRNKIWFIGASVSFESVKSVSEYNMLLLSRMEELTKK